MTKLRDPDYGKKKAGISLVTSTKGNKFLRVTKPKSDDRKEAEKGERKDKKQRKKLDEFWK